MDDDLAAELLEAALYLESRPYSTKGRRHAATIIRRAMDRLDGAQRDRDVYRAIAAALHAGTLHRRAHAVESFMAVDARARRMHSEGDASAPAGPLPGPKPGV